MSKPRPLQILDREALHAMHTGSLLTRLRQLWNCGESAALSDYPLSAIQASAATIIGFKDTPEWKQAYQDLKEILSRREHLPTAAQRRFKRLLRAQRPSRKA